MKSNSDCCNCIPGLSNDMSESPGDEEGKGDLLDCGGTAGKSHALTELWWA